jgi:cytosine/adenosine deaminase-related metal-dependent hydrolase
MHGPPVDGGWVRIERGRIVAVGRRSPPGPVEDLGDAVILPGLVNAHTHLEFSDRGIPLETTGGLPAWIERVVTLRRGRDEDHAAERARVTAAIAAGRAESAAAGVTAIGEIATSAPPAAYATFGPRMRVYREYLGLSAAAAAAAAARVARDIARAPAVPAAGLSPHAPYSVSAALADTLLDAARRRRLPVAMHIAESRAEEQLVMTGTGPFRDVFERLGIWPRDPRPRFLPAGEWIARLARAPRGIVVHGTFLPADEPAMARLARHRDRLAVVVCPRTTRALSDHLPPVAAFAAAGVRVALGTDSRASTPDLSVLAECRALADAGLASPAEALAMATRHAAWALMLEHRCGLIAPGRPADLVVVAPPSPSRDPFAAVLDPAARILGTMRGGIWLQTARGAGGRGPTAGSW